MSELAELLLNMTITFITIGITYMLGVYVYKRNQNNSTKKDLYTEVIDIISGFFEISKIGGKTKSQLERKLVTRLMIFNSQIMLYGTKEVIYSWAEFREKCVSGYDDPYELLEILSKLIVVMRSELGFSNKGFSKNGRILLNTFLDKESKISIEDEDEKMIKELEKEKFFRRIKILKEYNNLTFKNLKYILNFKRTFKKLKKIIFYVIFYSYLLSPFILLFLGIIYNILVFFV